LLLVIHDSIWFERVNIYGAYIDRRSVHNTGILLPVKMTTNSHTKILPTHGLTYDDVVIYPQYSEVISRKDVDISVEIAPGIKLTSPITASNMDTVISVDLCVSLSECGGIAWNHQFQSIEKEVEVLVESKKRGARLVGCTIGATADFLDRAKALIENGADIILIDTPHADSLNCINAIKAFRKQFGKFPLIAGTVATRQGAYNLIKAGVDGLKVGIGSGAACLTRVNAGCGVPQLTAVLECAEITRKEGKSLIADAGIKVPGSFAKAIAAGANAAMMGAVFAGSLESPSTLVEKEGKKFKVYYGSASHAGKQYRVDNDPTHKKSSSEFIEGGEGLVKYHGTVEEIVTAYTMGLRSAMSYSGAFSIPEFHEKALFMQVSPSGIAEGGAHGLV
jgi:IMP dehydrogenase